MISQVLALYGVQQHQVAERLNNTFEDQLQRTQEAALRWQCFNQDLFQEMLASIKGLPLEQVTRVIQMFAQATLQSAKWQVYLVQPSLNLTQELDRQLIQTTDEVFRNFLECYQQLVEANHQSASKAISLEHQRGRDLLALEKAQEQAKMAHEHNLMLEELRHQKEMLKIKGTKND